ncbi:MAG: hypothetical protein AAFU83_01490 [Bacteroidota bacterium]
MAFASLERELAPIIPKGKTDMSPARWALARLRGSRDALETFFVRIFVLPSVYAAGAQGMR